MSTIGFIGLGNMGAPMAANLIKSGERVLGFDVVAAARQASAEYGVQIAASARGAVEDADVVIGMLPGVLVARRASDYRMLRLRRA